MANGKLSLLAAIIIISIKLFGTSDAWPQMDYSYESSHIPSGILRPISGSKCDIILIYKFISTFDIYTLKKFLF
ncbi:hypothetical protein TNCV_813141 [Trichonephila clavipes]|nr:hypothetical protein TNCV_813141 [Trichonephila clavipes]